MESDQPLTPMGRFTIQSIFDSVINCIIALEHPIDPKSVRAELSNSLIFRHPRFCSLVVRDSHGVEHWRKTDINVDRHVIVHPHWLSDDSSVSDDDAVNDYVGNLCCSTPLPMDKPLWEIHLLLAHKTVVFRVHHALGDGTSVMAVLLECLGRSDSSKKQEIGASSPVVAERRRRLDLWKLMKVVWYTLVYVVGFLLRAFWRKDKTTVSGGEGVELWPRRLATARFRLEDMKIVKRAVANATINDVLSGVVSSGLSKYLEITSTKALQEGHQITGLVMVNVRPQPGLQTINDVLSGVVSSGLSKYLEITSTQALQEGHQITGLVMVNVRSQSGLQNLSKMMDGNSYGNKFGMILFPTYYRGCGADPLQFVKTSKSIMDRKKLSLEALLSHKIVILISPFLGAKLALKFAISLLHRIMCNTTFLLSNIMGPAEEITFAGNPVKYLRITI